MFGTVKFGAVGFVAGVIALLGFGWPHDATAQISAQCKADYQAIFDSLNSGESAELPDGAIGWALKVEKNVNGGDSTCPKMDAETQAFLRNRAAASETGQGSTDVANGGSRAARLVAEGREANKNSDNVTARRKWLEACEAGSGEGCAFAGTLIGKGHGGAQDVQKSFALFRKACDLNLQSACEVVGDATGVRTVSDEANEAKINRVGPLLQAENVAGAQALLKETCDDGYARGCAMYAGFLERVVQSTDTAQIARLKTKACQLGYKQACQ